MGLDRSVVGCRKDYEKSGKWDVVVMSWGIGVGVVWGRGEEGEVVGVEGWGRGMFGDGEGKDVGECGRVC